MQRGSLQFRLAVRLALLLLGMSLAALVGLVHHTRHVEARHGGSIVHDVLREFFVDLAWVIPVVVVLALAIGIWSIRRDLAPLKAASVRMQQIAPGASSSLATVPGLPSEVRPLVSAIDDAVERLQQAYARERQLTADAAHQMRTPLAVLVSGIEALPASPMREDLLRDATRLQRMMAQLLDMARVESGSPSNANTCDIAAIVAEVARDMAPAALAEGVELAFDAPECPTNAQADPAFVETITRNLLGNAIAHAPHGSTVSIAVSPEACLVIDDAGPGIPACERDAIFHRFTRGAWSTHVGSGLGLAIVRAAAERVGATVSVGDSPMNGARFVVAFAPGSRTLRDNVLTDVGGAASLSTASMAPL
jgi:signal transduction histidine kinase